MVQYLIVDMKDTKILVDMRGIFVCVFIRTRDSVENDVSLIMRSVAKLIFYRIINSAFTFLPIGMETNQRSQMSHAELVSFVCQQMDVLTAFGIVPNDR
jgi:hypothetical protein